MTMHLEPYRSGALVVARRHAGAVTVGATALGALAVGAVALGKALARRSGPRAVTTRATAPEQALLPTYRRVSLLVIEEWVSQAGER